MNKENFKILQPKWLNEHCTIKIKIVTFWFILWIDEANNSAIVWNGLKYEEVKNWQPEE